MRNKKNKTNSGDTIIELMISISLFLVIVASGMTALLNANLLHQKSEAMSSIIDSLSFVMEDMSRNLRTGYDYHCIAANSDFNSATTLATAASGANCFGIAFESASGDPTNNNDQWVYYIGGGKIFKAVTGPYNAAASYVQMTPDEVVINPVAFISVLGAEPPTGSTTTEPPAAVYDQQQPLVGIKLIGTITVQGVTSPFSIQTSVSQRLLDI